MKLIAIACALIAGLPLARAQDQVIRAERPAQALSPAEQSGKSHRDAILSNPTDPLPYFKLARIAQESGRLEEALAWIRAVKPIAKEPGAAARADVEEMLLADSLARQRENTPEPAARVAARAAMAAGVKLAQDNAAQADAEAKFLEALQLDPTFAEPRFNLAVLADRNGDVAAAVRAYEEYMAAAPTMPQALTAERRVAHLRPAPAAATAAPVAPAIDAERYRKCLELALTAMETGQRDEAIKHLGDALASAPVEQRAKLQQTLESLRASSATSAAEPKPAINQAPRIKEAKAAPPSPAPARTVTQREPCSTCRGGGTCTICAGAKGQLESCGSCNGTGERSSGSCASCSGDGRTRCQPCNAEGQIESRCFECVGGNVECTTCNGSGKGGGEECIPCAGRGTRRCFCGGSGTINGETCVSCGGEGTIDCISCFGRGKGLEWPCVGCAGDGRDDCSRCDGHGTVEETCSACSGARRSGVCTTCAGRGQISNRCTSCNNGQTFRACSTCAQTGRCTPCSGQGFRMVEVTR